MPDRRPPPVRLNAAPRNKSGSSKSKTPKPPRKRKPRASGNEAKLLYWIAGGLVFVLVVLVVIYAEADTIKAWFTNVSPGPLPQEAPLPGPAPAIAHTALPSVPPKAPTPAAEHQKTLKELADEQTRLLEQQSEQAAAKPAAPTPVPPTPPSVTTTPNALPPLVQPVPIGTPNGSPARALPVDMNKLDTERIAAYQVALERIHFSCGFIDGDQGMRTQRMLRAFQTSHGLPVTGFLDEPTRLAIGEPGEPFLSYVVTQKDVDAIMPKPTSWIAKSKATRLGYNDIWEELAEKFHCTRAYLKGLNPGVTTPVAGTEMIGPKVYPAAPIPQAASLRILLSETSIEALDKNGRIIAFFPCSIAKDKNKRPHGLLTVKVVDPNPDYTFDPALFADAAKAEGITHKMVLPPGPRNPVGTTWVGLSLPGYGIHGTPEPENISRTQSHGCFRLANWNAEKVLKMVHVGTPVDVEP
jgi:lipoprotein-anchoring transpeptidase ErfK/SrfK